MTTGATVFVVDDNVSVCQSMRALLESAGLVVETFTASEEFLAVYDSARAGCLVLDVRLRHGRNGLDLQDELRRRKATLPIIVLTGHGSVSTSVRAFKAGAFDFLQKPTPPKVLLERIRAALQIDCEAHAIATQHEGVIGQLAHLTPREREVMELLLKGKTSKEIADTLHRSVRTVEGHRRMVFMKMGVSSAAQLVGVVMNTRQSGARA